MEQKANSRTFKGEKKTIAIRKLIAIIVLGAVLLCCLLAFGYFGAKTLYRSHQRRDAMAAYEKGDYEKAEHLLRAYIQKDPNAEAELAALANIYRKNGNTGLEAQMWQMASSLNPLNAEYRKNMLVSAASSASYALLHGLLVRKAKNGETLADQELYLYVISSYRSGHSKDAEEAYKKALKADPEVFRKDELGRMAEFMVTYDSLSEGERSDFLTRAIHSEDPVIRSEGLYTAMTRARADENDDEVEDILKKIVETNYFTGTPLLADFYYSKYRFSDVIAAAEPYLQTIDDANLSLLYAESCVFAEKPDKLKALAEKLRKKNGILSLLADYCETMIAYMENDVEKLAATMRKSGKLISSPLSSFMHLRVAMEQDSFNEILVVANEIFSSPPFHDLSNRTMLLCLDYLADQMRKPENQDDPSQMAELAKVLATYLQGNRLLTEIILSSRYKKGLVAESELLEGLNQFPDDLLLAQITAEYLVFNNKPEQALTVIELFLKKDISNPRLDFMYMLALDHTGRNNEAAEIFRRLVEQSKFDLNLLAEYFRFCWKYERSDDLSAMGDKLESASDGMLKPFADFFRAAVLLLEDDEAKKQEALKLLAASPNDDPNFTFFAANRLSEADMLAEAEAKYKAIQQTYKDPALILVNLSEVYKEKGETEKALETAKAAFDMERKSMLSAFIYARRLSEAERYDEAVEVLKFPRHAVTYNPEIVELWTDCMKKVIEKSMADRRFIQAEEQCKHLLVVVPDDDFGRENLEKVRKALHSKKDNGAAGEEGVPAA